MKLFLKVVCYLLFLLISLGFIFRTQEIYGANILLFFGFLGLTLYYIGQTIQSLMKGERTGLKIILQIATILMSIILWAKYVHHSFADYPGLVIIPVYIILSILYWVKAKNKELTLTLVSILYFAFSIPLFGFEYYGSPRHYLPEKSNNRYVIAGKKYIPSHFSFKYEKTEALSVEAFDLRKSKMYNEAINVYRKAMKLEPLNPKLYFDISECYANINNLESAISVLDTAILIDSTYLPFYVNRGLLYYKLNENENAKKDYLKAIELDPTEPLSFANLALVYFYGDRDFFKACKAIQKAEQLGLDLSTQKELKKIKRETCN